MHSYRSHTCADLNKTNVGSDVRLSGWVHRIRDHGGVLFVDLRDHYGITQVLCDPDSPVFSEMEKVRSEWCIRIDGTINLSTAPLSPNSKTWVLRLSNSILRSSDPWLLHKSSNRDLYDAERANLPDGIDELVYLNERNEVCEGTITNIFVKIDGHWLTPPLSSGCLPGVLRRKKIEDASCKVKIITFSDLQGAEKITVGNALRGEIEAVLKH